MTRESSAIRIAAIGTVSPALIDLIERRVAEVFGVAVSRYAPGFAPDVAFDANRQQHDSTLLLEALLNGLPGDQSRVIGVTEFDLFVPVFTFVFGEAQLRGRVAVMSVCRLRNSFYGLPDDYDLLGSRAVKEAIHELGHTFGFVHCHNPACVMSASPGVEEVDLKQEDFCGACRRTLVTRCGKTTKT